MDEQEMSPEEQALEAELTGATPEAATEQAPKPASESEPAPKLVPIQALDEARYKLKELSDSDRQKSEKLAKMEARFEEMMKRLQPAAPKAPEYDQDPLGHLKHETTDVRAKLAEFEQWKAEQAKQAERQTQEQEFLGKYRAAATEFSSKTKDFNDAYAHLMTAWGQELLELGYTQEEQASEKLMLERRIVEKALKDGANPAERIYKAAKMRGFKGPEPEKELAKLKSGQQAAKSLSAVNGSQEPPMTLEALAEMDGEDFDKFFDKIVLGGRKNVVF